MNRAMTAALMAGLLGVYPAAAQSLQIFERSPFNEFVTFYVSSVDISTGATDVRLFDYELRAVPETAYPVRVEIVFEVLVNSIPLGLDYSTPFLSVAASIDTMWGPVGLSNTELNTEVDHLTYSGGPKVGLRVDFNVTEVVTIFDDPDYNLDDLQSLIIQTGRLPDGSYRFRLTVTPEPLPGGDPGPWTGDELDRTIFAAHPIALELISPGGPLEDTTNTAIATTYPFFQWESDPCAICGYQIRVARYIPGEHSSMDDAIEDQTVLPLDQALGYYDAGNITSLQYPLTGAVDLEPGRIYVWQVQKTIPTSAGDETISSFIWALKIIDPSVVETPGATEGGVVVSGPVMELIQSALGTERFGQAFEVGGELEGFAPNNVLRLNGEAISVDRLRAISTALQQGEISIITVEVQ